MVSAACAGSAAVPATEAGAALPVPVVGPVSCVWEHTAGSMPGSEPSSNPGPAISLPDALATETRTSSTTGQAHSQIKIRSLTYKLRISSRQQRRIQPSAGPFHPGSPVWLPRSGPPTLNLALLVTQGLHGLSVLRTGASHICSVGAQACSKGKLRGRRGTEGQLAPGPHSTDNGHEGYDPSLQPQGRAACARSSNQDLPAQATGREAWMCV